MSLYDPISIHYVRDWIKGSWKLQSLELYTLVELLVPLVCYLYSARKVDNTGYSSLISNAHNLKNYILVTMNAVIGAIAPVGGRWPHGRRYYSSLTCGYFTQGNGHTGMDCQYPDTGHINTATLDNTQGGNSYIRRRSQGARQARVGKTPTTKIGARRNACK